MRPSRTTGPWVWSSPELAIVIGLRIKQHARASTTSGGPSSDDRGDPWNGPGWTPCKAVLGHAQLKRYEIFVQLVRQEVTVIEAADHWQVDRGVIMRFRTVAKEGAMGALSESRPGRREKEREMELLASKTGHLAQRPRRPPRARYSGGSGDGGGPRGPGTDRRASPVRVPQCACGAPKTLPGTTNG